MRLVYHENQEEFSKFFPKHYEFTTNLEIVGSKSGMTTFICGLDQVVDHKSPLLAISNLHLNSDWRFWSALSNKFAISFHAKRVDSRGFPYQEIGSLLCLCTRINLEIKS